MTTPNCRNAVSVAGLLLAAGESRRMGETNKMLLPVHGQTLLKRSVDLLAGSALDPVAVVLGYRLADSAPVVSGAGLPFVINERYTDGQQSSLRVGLEAIGGTPHACMVVLADLPLLKGTTLDALWQAVQQCPDADAWIPTYQGKWGNPRVLSQRLCRALRNDNALSSRDALAAARDNVELVPVDDPGVVQDIDTPDEYRAFLDVSVR